MNGKMVRKNYNNRSKAIFWARSITKPEEKEMQGIIFLDGKVIVGIDAWRLLDKKDYPSYPTQEYSSPYAMHFDYKKIPINRGYYLNNNMKGEQKNGILERIS